MAIERTSIGFYVLIVGRNLPQELIWLDISELNIPAINHINVNPANWVYLLINETFEISASQNKISSLFSSIPSI